MLVETPTTTLATASCERPAEVWRHQSAPSSLDAFGNDNVQIPLPSKSLYILTQYTCRYVLGAAVARLKLV